MTCSSGTIFLSTPSARRATRKGKAGCRPRGNFYPRPPRGGRLRRHSELTNVQIISIHALREEGDRMTPSASTSRQNFYPRPPRGGRPRGEETLRSERQISIHALREEGDLVHRLVNLLGQGISIHALREEGDRSPWKSLTFPRYFYPRPPRGGRPLPLRGVPDEVGISIHALREEGDRRTRRPAQPRKISIHALREEGDSKNRDKISIFKQIIQHSARI